MSSAVTIPPRFSRIMIGCLIVVALLMVLWMLGDTRLQRVAYNWQEQLNSSPVSAGSAQAGPGTSTTAEISLAIRTVSFSNNSGVIALSYSQYTSYDSDATELLKRWQHHHGWAFNAYSDVPRSNPFSIPARIAYSGVQVAGFGIIQSSRQGEDATTLRVPIPFLIVLIMIPPACAAWRRRRLLQRTRNGLCLRCGYLLSGAATCPECGTPVAA